MSKSSIYLIAVPIGSYLSDLSTSGLQCIKNTPILFVESTGKILKRLIRKGIVGSDHQLIELNEKSLDIAKKLLQEGTSFALIADSGNPCFVDPGYDIIEHVLDEWLEKVHLVPLGMSSALDAALSMAGMDIQLFSFCGHYPDNFHWELPRSTNTPVIFYVSGKAVTDWFQSIQDQQISWKRITLFRNIRNREGEKIYRIKKNTPMPQEITNNRSDNYVGIIELSARQHTTSLFLPSFIASPPYRAEMSLLSVQ